MSISELVQGDARSQKLLELEGLANEMARYYFVGFGKSILNIGRKGRMHFNYSLEQEAFEEMYRRINLVMEFYDSLSFDVVKEKEEFED